MVLSIDDSFNTVCFTNIHFKCAQTVRLCMWAVLVTLTFTLAYILARLSFFYINIWALVLLSLAIVFISISAGR